MARGGARSGAGRPKGATEKRTADRLAAIEASGLTPLEYMLSVMRDEGATRAERMDAAKSSAPYVHARLASVELGGPDGGPLQVVINGMDADL